MSIAHTKVEAKKNEEKKYKSRDQKMQKCGGRNTKVGIKKCKSVGEEIQKWG